MAKLQLFSSLASPIEVEDSDKEMEPVSGLTKTPEPKDAKELDECKSTTKRRLSFSRIAAKVRQLTLEDDVELFHKQWPKAKQVGGRYLSRAMRLESDSESEGQKASQSLGGQHPALSEAEGPEISELAADEAGELSEAEGPEISELAEDEAGELSETERPGISELVLKFFPPRAQCPEISQSAEDEQGELSEAERPEIPELAEGENPEFQLPELEVCELPPPECPEIPEQKPAEERDETSPPEHPEISEVPEVPCLLVFAKTFLGWWYCGHFRKHVCCRFLNS